MEEKPVVGAVNKVRGRPKQLADEVPLTAAKELKVVKLADFGLKVPTMGLARLAFQMVQEIGEDEGILMEFKSERLRQEYRQNLYAVLKENNKSVHYVIKQMSSKVMLYKRL